MPGLPAITHLHCELDALVAPTIDNSTRPIVDPEHVRVFAEYISVLCLTCWPILSMGYTYDQLAYMFVLYSKHAIAFSHGIKLPQSYCPSVKNADGTLRLYKAISKLVYVAEGSQSLIRKQYAPTIAKILLCKPPSF